MLGMVVTRTSLAVAIHLLKPVGTCRHYDPVSGDYPAFKVSECSSEARRILEMVLQQRNSRKS